MLSCLRTERRENFVDPIIRQQRPIQPSRAQRKLLTRIYNNQDPIIKNEFLDQRDERIYIPFNKQRCGNISSVNDEIISEVSQWLTKTNYVIASRGFRHLVEGRLTEVQSKTFASRNMLINIKEFMGSLKKMREKDKQDLMVQVNTIQINILAELMLKYPQNTVRGASKRIKNLVKKIDNRPNHQYDFLYKNGITFNYRPDGHYGPDVMRALNKMISFANQVYQTSGGQDQDSYFQVWSQIIGYVVANDVKNNAKQFFTGFDYAYSPANDDEHFSFNDYSKNQQQDKIKEVADFVGDKLEDASRTKLKINHKIPLQANLFTEQEIESGQCKIRNSSVLRVIAKWTYELLDNLQQPKQLFLQRGEKFKLVSKKLQSLQNNQKLAIYEAAIQQKERIDEYISSLKNEYILLQTIFAEQKSRPFTGNQDSDMQVYALRVRQIYSQCLFKLLCKLVDSLKRIPRTASEIYLQKYENQLPEDELRFNYQILRQVDLVTFKVGDLIRAKYACTQTQFAKVYKNLIEISEQRPQILKVVRIKNRLDHKQNDILLNLFFMNKILCELQLSFERVGQQNALKAKQYTSYNHFLYELRRSLLGPIGQFASILGQYDPVISQIVTLDKNLISQEPNILLQQGNNNHMNQKRKSTNELFIPEKMSESAIQNKARAQKQISPRLKDIHEILFFCEHCSELKRPPNLNFSSNKRFKLGQNYQDSEENDRPIMINQCKQCFLAKLQQSISENKLIYLLKIIFGQINAKNQLYFKHLIAWDKKKIPKQFRGSELGSYLPREGFMLNKESRILNFQYFRTFTSEDETFFVTKPANQCQIIAKISQTLYEDEILQELTNLSRKFFIFQFDNNVIIQDGASLGFGKQGQVDTAVCKVQCCRQPVILGAGVEYRQFSESINRIVIKKHLQQFKNVMYLSKRSVEGMLNEIVLEDKKYDRACRNINIVQAEDSHFKDIRFVAKMINLSDLYINYNSNLISLKGIQFCKNLKILYCNQCKISSILQLRNLQSLQQLYINENELASLQGLQNCTNLKSFSCFWNQISTLLPIKNCKNIQKLNIGQNNIKSLTPLSSLLKLKSLATSKNDLISLQGIQTLSNLQIIDFSHTSISNIKLLQECPKIQRIFCSNTQISTLSDVVSPNLIELDIGQCSQIKEFDLSKISCASLEQLTADKCANLQRLKNIQFCIELREFYLQENPSLFPQQFALIGKCSKLQDLNLNKNKTLSSLYFLQKLQRLSTLTCSRCDLLNNLHFNSIKRCVSIQTLNLSYNRNLTSTQFLKGCQNIAHINLSGTGIRKFQKAFSKMQEMRYLQLKDIKQLQITNFQFLKDSLQMQKIVIDEIYDIYSLKGIEKMSKIKQVLIGRMIKNDQNRLKRLEKQLETMPIKVQRSVRLMYDPFQLK